MAIYGNVYGKMMMMSNRGFPRNKMNKNHGDASFIIYAATMHFFTAHLITNVWVNTLVRVGP
jgi:hypothetical protein